MSPLKDLDDLHDTLTENGALLADGFEPALIGWVEQFTSGPLALYDRQRCIDILMKDGLSWEEADEYFTFNVTGAWTGDGTPAFAELLPGTAAPRIEDKYIEMC